MAFWWSSRLGRERTEGDLQQLVLQLKGEIKSYSKRDVRLLYSKAWASLARLCTQDCWSW